MTIKATPADSLCGQRVWALTRDDGCDYGYMSADVIGGKISVYIIEPPCGAFVCFRTADYVTTRQCRKAALEHAERTFITRG